MKIGIYERLWLFYRCALAVGTILVFYTEIDVYLHQAGIGPIPLLWLAAWGAAATPLLWTLPKRIKELPTPLIVWCGVFLAISLVSFLISTQSEITSREIRLRMLAIFFILVSTFIFTGSERVQLWARRAIFIAVLITIFNNFYELLNPGVFAGINITGRPAGFHLDANRAGYTPLLGMLFCLTLLPMRYRLYFVGIVILGAAVTFSRGTILGIPLVLVMLTLQKMIPKRQIVAALILLFACISLTGFSTDNLFNLASDLNLDDEISKRLETFFNPDSSRADDDTSRKDIVFFSLDKIQEKPVLGHGTAHTQEWTQPLGPHNMYLLYMVEHGVLGFLIYPSFLLIVCWQTQGEAKKIGRIILPFMLIWGIFSHTVLEERTALSMFTLLTAININSQTKSTNHPVQYLMLNETREG